MIITHNMTSINTCFQLNKNEGATSMSLRNLSSGLRINNAADDAAGLAISEKMKGQISGLQQAARNSQDGISLLQTGDFALAGTHNMLQRMRELAVKAASDTYTMSDRTNIQKEVDQLAQEISKVANKTEFNTMHLLDGSLYAALQIGANVGQMVNFSIGAMDAETLGIVNTIAKVTANGQIANGAVPSSLANQMLDGSYLSFQFYAASPAKLSGASANFTTSLATCTTASINISVTQANGSSNTYVIDNATLKTWDGLAPNNSAAAAEAFWGAAKDNSNNALSSVASIQYNGVSNNMTIVTNDAGEKLSIKINYVLADAFQINKIQSAFGFQNGDNQYGISAYVEVIKSDTGYGEYYAVTPNATDLAISDNSQYSGVSINLVAGKTLSDLQSQTDNIVVHTAPDITKGVDVSNQNSANAAIGKIDKAINIVSAQRGIIGAYQNRLEYTINNLNSSSQNTIAAKSRITDVDMATEMITFQKNNIFLQATQAMLARANLKPQSVLQLLT